MLNLCGALGVVLPPKRNVIDFEHILCVLTCIVLTTGDHPDELVDLLNLYGLLGEVLPPKRIICFMLTC